MSPPLPHKTKAEIRLLPHSHSIPTAGGLYVQCTYRYIRHCVDIVVYLLTAL